MFCPECGAWQKDEMRFCTKCGKPLPAAPPAQSEHPAPPVQPVAPAQPAPPAQPAQPAPPVAPAQPARADNRLTIAALVSSCVALVLVVALFGVATNGFGLLNDASSPEATTAQEPVSAEGADEGLDGLPASEGAESGPSDEGDPSAPAVLPTVNDYSWEELSQISQLISAAPSQDEALDIAAQYHLCNADGSLDGTQTKEFVIGNSMLVSMQVAGFNHDTRADGTGVAGITFIARTSLGVQFMNASNTTSGGWRDSDMREWMNGRLLDSLPKEVSSVVVPVVKHTNAVGETTDPASVVATNDWLWLPSYSELGGHMDIDDDAYDDVYNAEGAQYQLFSDLGVRWDKPNEILALEGVEFWWERTPDPMDGRFFMCVGPEGTPWYARVPSSEFDVVLCFCV